MTKPKSPTGTSRIPADEALRAAARRRAGEDRGFTLMEILVVLAIIGIVTAGVLLSLNLTGHDPALSTAARRLRSLMRYARGQAELQIRNYGIVFAPQGYRFVVYSEQHSRWRAVTRDDALRARQLPPGVSLKVVVDGRRIVLTHARTGDSKKLIPQVMLYSSGDLTSFSVTLERTRTHRGFVIKPNAEERIVEHPLAGAAR